MSSRVSDHSSGGRPPGVLTRRELVTIAISTLGVVVLGGCDESTGPRSGARSELPPTLLDLVEVLDTYFDQADTSGLRAVGQAYMERFGGDDNAVIADLAEAVRLIADVDEMDSAVEILESAVRDDFATDRRALVDGWQLSITEARLCGVVAFLA